VLWDITDNDRLARAAMSLEANGIVFRENFTCCQTCGFTEIGEEVRATQALGSPIRGFVFFHWQDTESAVTGHGLHLSFGAIGSFDEATYETAACAVAHEVTDSIVREGLSASWGGSLTSRIAVEFTWQRRRFTAPPLVELDA
jgi:hypothetical protein